MASVEAFIAVNRFGLGPRPGELDAAGRDPAGWLTRQIDPAPPPLPVQLQGLPPSADWVVAIHTARLQGPKVLNEVARKESRKRYAREATARAHAQTASVQSFRERMVAFWSNHFSISVNHFGVGPMVGAYEREAIRPHVFGRFVDLLLAVMHHPGMLSYLDNYQSFGPHSTVGSRTGRGLNENLAREVLELHTLGVNGGYTQADVIAFAKMLTGWTHGGLRNRHSLQTLGPIHGRFEFQEMIHEPGSKTFLGKTYHEDGEGEATAALKFLARHPSTARFIATKLVRHFVADDPPAEAVAAVARVFTDTGGDLAQVSRALIALGAAWEAPLPKVKSPNELLISVMRALALDKLQDRQILGTLRQLGQATWFAPSPQGWPDDAAHWLSPESLMLRVEWSHAVAERVALYDPPQTLIDETIAPVIAPVTQEAIDAAPSGTDAVSMLLSSPEFQRR